MHKKMMVIEDDDDDNDADKELAGEREYSARFEWEVNPYLHHTMFKWWDPLSEFKKYCSPELTFHDFTYVVYMYPCFSSFILWIIEEIIKLKHVIVG